MTSVTNSPADVVERWRSCFEASDAEGLKSLWLQDHPTLTYLPTEREAVMTSWPDIEAYYNRVAGSLNVVRWRIWDVVSDVTSDNSAFVFAYTDMYYESKVQSEKGRQYWQGRVSFHLTKAAGEWKIVHYEDSTLMQWLLPLVSELQLPRLREVVDAVRSGNSDEAIRLLDALAEPVPFYELTAIAQPPYATT